MKKFYSFLIAAFLLLTTAQAQVVVYHENFNNTVTGAYKTNFVLSDAHAYTDTLYTGGSYMQTDVNATGQQVLRLDNSISTYNLHNLTITWKEIRSQYYRKNKHTVVTAPGPGNSTSYIPNTNPVTLEYSLDGVTYKAVTGFTQNTTSFFTWNAVNKGVSIKLPFEVNNQPNVRFRWKINVNNENTDFYGIDDVLISGTPVTGVSTFSWASRPVGERPFDVSSTRSTEPYTVDGVTMRWVRSAVGTGATVETDNVNTGFLKKKALNLIQTGAAAESGTQVTLILGKSVSGLTFTLHDIDRNAGQFRDKIVVTGYNGANAIALTKNQMIPTFSNEFSNGAAMAKADGVDAKVTSNRGNVTISFVEDVDRVEIKYLNNDAARGRQGIAIGDISWATADGSIAPMPVELMSFRAQLLNNQAVLGWATAMEKDNNKFIVERSLDGKTFTKVGEVKGSGNSSAKLNYTFTDAKPATGTNYYRLQQVDFSGETAYSNIVAVDVRGVLAPKLMLYPTVATEAVNISLNGLKGNVDVYVLDATGRTVKQLKATAEQELLLPVQDLKSGAYFVSVVSNEHRETLRFIKK
ncbi:T9SS type A sorting domain-containing protein [uncultured Pontibacter sp.]|uniref:T9SS type A sorting domain-containing protein n=1 Tax=uncultured Pontibacter sp. TaxID=453356 RepID=UPI0026087AA9|nr:T9SS type A sorting domain-containing protein [uncultured Pontibacter sp.]